MILPLFDEVYNIYQTKVSKNIKTSYNLRNNYSFNRINIINNNARKNYCRMLIIPQRGTGGR